MQQPLIQPEALQPGQQAKRHQILKATRKLLAQRGFHGFSVKQLALEAGVAAGTIYLYFRDREDLIEQLHMEIIHDIADVAFLKWDESEPAEQRYRGLCHQIWDYCIAHPDTLLCKGQFEQLPPDVLRSQYTSAKTLFAPLSELFEEGRQSGELLNLPNDALFCISVDTFWPLARSHNLGMLTVDEALLEQVITGTWRGISQAR
ncbi:TetR family transcriptional regulator [Alteromonadaceae bacterium 2753L.S.0a.02]|nr:TetR family transcriptional regulator [Alteromonadaceae bacterium 2753L.S.0a.02]